VFGKVDTFWTYHLVRPVHQLWHRRHNDVHFQTPPVYTLLVCSFGLKDHVALIVLFVLILACCWAAGIILRIITLINLIHTGTSSVILIPRVTRPGWNCNRICTYQWQWSCWDRWPSRPKRTCTTGQYVVQP
jgi:hypothetical protein